MSPNIHQEHGFAFRFWSNEGQELPHVHVHHADGVAKVWLDPPLVQYSIGLSPAQHRRMLDIVETNRFLFLEQWREFFGS